MAKLSGFAAIFFFATISFGLVLAFAGVTPSDGLTVWNVLPLLVAALTASWIFVRIVERRPLRSLGLRPGSGGLSDLTIGTIAGALIVGLVVLAAALFQWVSWNPVSELGSPLGAGLTIGGVLLVAAFVEELLFRGYPFQVLARRFNPATAILVTSIAFGLLHAWNPNVQRLALINIALAGILLGVAYWRTGSLWFVTGVHLGWNWVMAVSELSVSGIEMSMPTFEPAVTGPVLWTGGEFGPEGGLLATIATVLGTVWMWRLGRRDESLSMILNVPAEAMSNRVFLPREGVSDNLGPTND
jgi:membrane protease YdiL (CAAX protease family)